MADRVGSPHRGNVSSLVNWEKGQSGNPKGRPKKNHALIDYVHQKTSGGKKLIDELYKIAMSDDGRDRDRMRAIELLLERGFGKIINVSTSDQTMVRKGYAPYGPSKAAIEAAWSPHRQVIPTK